MSVNNEEKNKRNKEKESKQNTKTNCTGIY